MKELTQLNRTDVPNLNVLQSKEYKDYMASKGLEEFSAALQQSWEGTTAEHWPFYPEFTSIGDTFTKEISAAIAGSKSVDDALETAQSELTTIMKNAGHLK